MRPAAIIVMGVSGSGKSTIGALLAERLGWPFADADGFHPAANVAKMAAGQPLTDEDRWPWLDRIASYLKQDNSDSGHQAGGIVACSALKRIYRDRIRRNAGPVVFLFLDGSSELIRQRMQARVGHYMQAGLLDSQLQTLEKPTPEETDVITLQIDQAVPDILQQALQSLKSSALNALP
jgi:carbohydrate kinase (thermoresistant glucokinase family)